MMMNAKHLLYPLLSALLFLTPDLFGQDVAGEFRTRQNGNWTNSGTWEEYDGTSWSNTGNTPTSADDTIKIRNGHSVSLSSNVTADQILVQNGTLDIDDNTLTLNDGSGDDLIIRSNGTVNLNVGFGSEGIMDVAGTVINQGSINNNGTLTFQGTATYQHDQDGGTVPDASWNAGSTCLINYVDGDIGTAPGGLAQTFSNFEWAATISSTLNIAMTSSTNINNDLTVSATGGNVLVFSEGTATISVQNNFDFTGGSCAITQGSGDVTLDVDGNFNHSSGGTLYLNFDGEGTLRLAGNMNWSAGSITELSGGTSEIRFDGSTAQSISKNGPFSNNIDFIVEGGAVLDLGTEVLDGSGDFTLATNGTLRVGSTHSDGALQTSGSGNGNIQVGGTRTYQSSSTIVYNGASEQFFGDEWGSAISDVSLTIDNPVSVAMDQDITIADGQTLTLNNGSLRIPSGRTLTLGNITLVDNGGDIAGVSSTSHLTFNGTSAIGPVPFDPDTNNIGDLTLNGNGLVLDMGGDFTVSGSLNLTQGTLDISGDQLTLEGSDSRNQGNIDSDNNSRIEITSTAIGDNGNGMINFTSSATLGDLILNLGSLGEAVELGDVRVADSVDLQQGTLTITNLAISDGGTIVRHKSDASLTNAPTVHGSYNLGYGLGVDNISAGSELTSDTLNTLHLFGGAANTLSVGQNLTIYNALTFADDGASEVLNLNNNNLTLKSLSSGTARIGDLNFGSISNLGTFTMERWLTSGGNGAGWIDLGSPVPGKTIEDWDQDIYMSGKSTAGFVGFAHDQDDHLFWSVKQDTSSGEGYFADVTSTSWSIERGRGYEVFLGDEGGTSTMNSDITMDISNASFNEGSFTGAIRHAGWNLVANPYPSPISLQELINDYGGTINTIEAANASSSFQTLNSSDVIAPWQGFWVETSSTTDLSFQEDQKASSGLSFLKSGQGNLLKQHFELELSNANGQVANTKVRPLDGANSNADQRDIPASVMPAKADIPNIFTHSEDDRRLRFNTLDRMENHTVPVFLRSGEAGTYDLKAYRAGQTGYQCVLLEDVKTGEVHDLKSSSSVTVEFADARTREHRFNLHLKHSDCQIAAGVEDGLAQGEAVIIDQDPDGADINFRFKETTDVTLSVHDMLGKKVMEDRQLTTRKGTERVQAQPNMKGVYIISVTTPDNRITKKVHFR